MVFQPCTFDILYQDVAGFQFEITWLKILYLTAKNTATVIVFGLFPLLLDFRNGPQSCSYARNDAEPGQSLE